MTTVNKDFKVKNGLIVTGKTYTPATTTTQAGLSIPHGTAPSSPVNGDIWSTTAGFYVRVNGVTVGPLGTGGGGGASVTVQDAAPSSPSVGDLWYQSSTGKTFIWYDSFWVEIGNAGNPLTLTGDVTGTGSADIVTTLAASGVAAGTYNNVATQVRPFTVDTKGRLTSIGTAVTITPAFGSITGTPTTLSGYGITDAINTSATGQSKAGDLTIGGLLTVTGDLVVNGTTTTINAATITVDDINIELGSVTSPTNATANGGGITLRGTTDKTIIWDSTNTNWTSSENWNIVTGKTYKINNVAVLSSTTLGSTVTASSLTSVGTVASGTWSASFGAVSGANLTNLTAGNLSGTIPSAVLGNSTYYIGTTAIALNRASAAQALTGITSIDGTAALASSLVGGNATTLLGSVPYQSNTNVTTLLGPNTTTTRKFLRQTGTGVNGAAPVWDTIIDADLPAAITGSTYNGLTLTALATGFSLAGGTTSKTLTVSNTMTLQATDGSTLNIGTGGTLGSAAYTASTAYAAVGATYYIGTTATTLNRASANLALTGISSIAFPGGTSGTAILQATAVAGTPTLNLPTASGTLVGTGDTGSITTNMLANASSTTTGVTYAKQQYVSAQYRVLGRISAAAGVTEELTPDNLVTVLGQATSKTGSGNIVFATSPTLSGTPLAVTAAVDTNTTQIATTAFVIGQGYLKTSTASTTYAALSGATFTGKVTTVATAVGTAGFSLPHGTAPSAPSNGDVWTTTAGLYARINGSTVGPFSSSGGATISDTAPGSPSLGQLWFDSTTAKTYLYYDSFWVQVGGSAQLAINLLGGNSTTLLGSIPYQSNTDTTTLLSPNTSATRAFLGMTGTGTNGAAPTWTSSTGTGNVVLSSTPTLTTPVIDTVTSAAVSTAVSGWNNVTTGSIAIGTGLTTGALNLGTGGTSATPITVGHTNATIALIGNTTVTGFVDASVSFRGQATDTVTTPSFTWTGDTTTGIYRTGAGAMAFTTTGTQRATITSTGITVTGYVDASVAFYGNASDLVSTPSFTWTGDTTTGIYRPAASQVGVTIAGTQRGLFSATGLAVTGALSATTTITATSTISASGLAGSLLTSTVGSTPGTAAAGSSAIPARSDHVHPREVAVQTGNSGLFLTTNGSATSWAAVIGSVYQANAPGTPSTGAIWVDSDVDVLYVYNGSTWHSPMGTEIAAKTVSYTLVLADRSRMIEISNASANTITVPPNSTAAFPIGTQITIVQTGAGQTTITPGAAVTINGTPGLKLRAQWSTATLVKRATDTWLAFGDLTA